MATTVRRMPTELAIRRHWCDRLWQAKGFDSPDEFMERGVCFACGMEGNERAHIIARSAGGSDDVENLHILCSQCHKDSEYLDGDKYMRWMLQRSFMDMATSALAKRGFNVWNHLMTPNYGGKRIDD